MRLRVSDATPAPTRHEGLQKWWNENPNCPRHHGRDERRFSSGLAIQLHWLGRTGFDPDLTALGVPDTSFGALGEAFAQQLPDCAHPLDEAVGPHYHDIEQAVVRRDAGT